MKPTSEESVATSLNIFLEKSTSFGNVLMKTIFFELPCRTQICQSTKMIYLNVVPFLTTILDIKYIQNFLVSISFLEVTL